MKKAFAALTALVCAVSLMSGCANGKDATKIKRKDKSSSVSEKERSENNPLHLSPVMEETTAEVFEDTTGAEQTEDTAPKYVETRTPVDCTVGGGYRFNVSDFDKVYSNEELQALFDRLNEICNETGFAMSFSYKNINTGAYVGYGQYNSYMTCSCVKAPYVKSLLVKDIDLNDKITLNEKWAGDDGILCNEDFGKEFTAKELIEYTILDSDNTAYQLLCRKYGTEEFNKNQYDLGSGYTLGYNGEWIFTYCTSDDMMKDYEDIYRFAEENESGKWLIDLLCNTHLNIQIGKALQGRYPVAQKYGSDAMERAFNDCAIVYANSPYVLCIFTNQYPETEESCEIFKELALVFDDINSLVADETVNGQG